MFDLLDLVTRPDTKERVKSGKEELHLKIISRVTAQEQERLFISQ